MGLSLWEGNNDTTSEKLLFKKILDKYGHNVLYRRYEVGTQSEFFDETTGQGKGGPSWEYYDEVIRVRHDPMSIRGAVGITIQKSKMYLEPHVKPKRGDVIIELDYDLKPDAKTHEIYHIPHREAFEIDEIDVKRGINGKIIYCLCAVVPHLGDY
tara:strand:- start:137 stop:601 length:465 start_codon:yes stop_codon:yes gene_type:complete